MANVVDTCLIIAKGLARVSCRASVCMEVKYDAIHEACGKSVAVEGNGNNPSSIAAAAGGFAYSTGRQPGGNTRNAAGAIRSKCSLQHLPATQA